VVAVEFEEFGEEGEDEREGDLAGFFVSSEERRRVLLWRLSYQVEEQRDEDDSQDFLAQCWRERFCRHCGGFFLFLFLLSDCFACFFQHTHTHTRSPRNTTNKLNSNDGREGLCTQKGFFYTYNLEKRRAEQSRTEGKEHTRQK
jgi:hypothetical protein